MEPVGATQVRNYWEEITQQNPNRNLEDEPTDMALGAVESWYLYEFTPNEFESLYHFLGPNWDEFTGGDNTICEAVEKIREKQLYDRQEDTPKIDNIRQLTEQVPFDGYMNRIVVVEQDDCLYTIDGNHRAAATILHYLETGEDVTITGFVGRTTDNLDWACTNS